MARKSLHFFINKFSYKTLLSVLFILLIAVVVLARFIFPNQKVSAAWFSDAWGYRKAVPITNTLGSILNNQRVKIVIDTSALITAGKLQSTCNDLRFTDLNGNLLDHWSTGCNTTTTNIYVKLSTLSTTGTTIYLYYGNSSAPKIEKPLGTTDTPGTSCQMMKDQGSVVANGLSYIVPGGADLDKQLVYCDQTTDGGGWALVMNQNVTTGGYFANIAEAQSFNEANPNAGRYSILGKLAKFKDNGIFTFKINWSVDGTRNIWSQTSDPTQDVNVAGYTPINIGTSVNGWGGLEYGNGTHAPANGGSAFIDGTVNTSTWYYAVASYVAWSGGIPAYSPMSLQTQLWVKGNNTMNNVSVGSLATEELSPAPIAYWKFDEGNGTTSNDSSSNKNNSIFGIGNSAPTWATEDQCISGKCLKFSGSNYSTYTNDVVKTANIRTQGITYSAWVKPNITSGTYRIVGQKPSSGYSDFASGGLGISANKAQMIAYDDGVAYKYATGNTTLNPNQWYYITGSYDPADQKIKIYVNGKLDGTSVSIVTFSRLETNASNTIGYQDNGNNYFYSGFLDDVKIFPYARSLPQIKSDYAAGLAHSSSSKGNAASLGSNKNNDLSSGLIGYWKMDEISGTASDSSGNGNTAPVTGLNNFGQGKFGNGLRTGVGTTNLNPNPSVETNTNGWSYWINSGTGVAVASNDTAMYGSYSYKATMTGNGNMGLRVGDIVASPSTTYSVSGWIKITSWGGASFPLYMREYYPTGNSQCGVNLYNASAITNGWVRFSGTCTTRADTTNLSVSYYLGDIGQVVYVDGIQIEQSSSPTPYVDGSLGAGYSWTGTAHASTSIRTNSYATSTSINLTNQFTLSTWVNALDYNDSYTSPYPSIINKPGSYSFMCDSGGIRLDTLGLSSTSFRVANTCLVSDQNKWQHWVAVYDGSNVILYKDGVEIGRKATTGTLTQNANLLQLNTNSSGTFTKLLAGSSDEVRIYNRALSPSEVSSLYNWAPGPVGYWDFEENTGNILNDKSGNNKTLTIYNSPLWSQGKFGSALSFNGSNQYSRRTGDPSFNMVNGQSITISAWIFPRRLGGQYQDLIANRSSSALNWLLYQHTTDGSIQLHGAAQNKSTYIPPLNQWTFISATVDPTGNYNLYANGKLVQSLAGYTYGSNSPSELTMGNFASTEHYLGKIDDVKIYNYARTIKQITEDMNGSHPAGSSNSAAAYYKFDEGSGTIINNIGNQGTSLNANFGAGSSVPTWTSDGKFNKALNFTTPNSYATISTSIFNNSSSFAASAWVKSNNTAQDQTILSANGPFFLRISGGKFRVGILTGGSWSFINGSISLTNNTWYHLTLVYDGNYIKSYVNGVLDTNTPKTGNLAGFNTIYIGYPVPGGENFSFNGYIDEIKIYNSALTADEIKLDYNRGASLQLGSLSASTSNSAPPTASSQQYCVPGDSSICSAPVAEWNFEENSGTTTADSSGNNNTGTLVNSPVWTVGQNNKGAGLKFNGSTTRITTPLTTAFNDFTVELWFKDDGVITDWERLVDKNYVAGFFLGRNSSTANSWGGGILEASAPNGIFGNFPDKQWNHMVSVRSGTTHYLYANGKLVNSNTVSSAALDTTALQIGNGTTNQAGGATIDQVRIFNYARTPAQIAFDYNRGSPIGWWKLDECQGSVANDSSGMGNTGSISIGNSGSQTSVGTCSNNLATSAWNNGKTGKYNSSLNFDGTDDTIVVGNPSALQFGTNDFSISLFTYRTATGLQGGSYFSSGNYMSAGFDCYDDNFRVRTSTGALASVGFSATLNKWEHHVFVVTQNSTPYIKHYINGVLNNSGYSGTGALGTFNSVFNFRIGISNAGGVDRLFNGKLDDFRVFNYALTSEQVKTLYNNGAVSFNP